MELTILAVGQEYIPIVAMLVISAVVVAAMVGLSWLFGPGRSGSEKGSAYECGVTPTGTARSRFHARFYLLAILFLLFDVELIFFYPWAVLFHESRSGLYLIEIGIFTLILLAAFIYAWARKVFDWR